MFFAQTFGGQVMLLQQTQWSGCASALVAYLVFDDGASPQVVLVTLVECCGTTIN